jgi:hypothetical protein
MTLPTDRRGNYSILLLWGVFFFCLFPFLLLSFFNMMTTDDFILNISCRDRGFFSTQSYIYSHWTGRYTATFMGSLLVQLGLSKWYFLHTWLLLGGTWSAIFFVLTTVNSMIMKQLYTPGALALSASVLLLLFLYVQVEISTGLYWFSAAVTYQTAFIFFLFLVGCMIRRYYTASRRYDVLIVLLILLIAGCNEIAAVFLSLFLFTLLVGCYYRTRHGQRRAGDASFIRMLLVYLLVVLVVDLLIVTSSGLFTTRYKEMEVNRGYISIFAIILFRAFSVFYAIFKTPLFWIAAATLYLTGTKIPSPLSSPLPPFKERKIFIPGLLILSGWILLTLMAICLVTRGSLPQRALNNLIDLTAFSLLALFFTAGTMSGPDWSKTWTNVLAKMHPWILPGLLISTMVATDSFADACSSCFTGYFYAAALKTREKQIEGAGAAHQISIVLPPFQQSLETEIRRVFPHGTSETVREWLQVKPVYLYYAQDVESAERGYAFFYGIDSVNIERTNGKDGKK